MIILEGVVVKFKFSLSFGKAKKPFENAKKPLSDTKKATLKNGVFDRFYDQLSSVMAVIVQIIIAFSRRKSLAASNSSTHQRFEEP